MDIYRSVKELIGSQLELEEDKISADTTFEELGADSLDLVDMISDIEREYEVEIAEGDFDKIKTVGDLVSLLGESI